MDKQAKVSTFSKLVTWAFLLSPILKTYGWGRYDFAFIFTVGLAIIYFFKYGFRNRMPKLLAIYLVYCYVSVIISVTSFQSLIQLSLVRIFLVYLMFYDVLDLQYTVKSYKIFGAIIISVFFIQEISYHLTGFRISGVFEFLPLNTGTDDAQGYFESVATGARSASLFSEPAHFVQTLFPLLCIEIFYDKSKNHLVYSAIIILALLLTQSGNAVFGLAAIFSYYFITKFKGRNKGRNVLQVILLLAVAIPLASIYIKSDIGQGMLERQNQLSVDDHGASMSGFRRIFRGYFVYDEYSIIEKITGLYNGERVAEKIKQSVVAYDFEEDDQYFNAVHNILLRTGIIGAIIFIMFIVGEWKMNSPGGRALLLVLIVLMFISAIYFTETMALYLVLSGKLKLDNIKNVC